MKLHPAFLDIFSILLSFYILVCVLIIQNINESVEAKLPEIELQKVNNKNNQLTSEERDKIAILRAEGKSLTLIATMINRNKSTISRELRRNNS